MARSVWKGPFVDQYILKKAEAARASGRKDVIKIWSRRSTILPQFVGLNFGVYNGQKFIPVLVSEDMVTSLVSFHLLELIMVILQISRLREVSYE